MELLEQTFSDRLAEIDEYLELLAAIESQLQSGVPRIGNYVVTVTQQKILYSTVYLQLYNLVEATITKCIETVCDAIKYEQRWKPNDLSPDLRREWVRYLARTHTDLNYENRLKESLVLCDHLIQALPVNVIDIEKGGGGNWDDQEIVRIATRIGCVLNISQPIYQAVRRPFKEDKGAMAWIRKLRNDLAHGTVSFVECGDGVTVAELRDLRQRTADYMNEVVTIFKDFVSSHQYLHESSRPA